jgi:regulator of nucleoside diphosphate kinase
MMDKQVQNIVSRAIAAAGVDRERCYHVCWWEDQVQCHHVHHTRDAHEAFFSAPGYVLLDGLSAAQWHLVTTRITEFCRSRGIDLAVRTGRHRPTRASEPLRRLTEFDSVRLRMLLTTARAPRSRLNTYLDQLQQLLETADIVAPRDIPVNVVTMNSRVRLRDDHVEGEMAVSLVFPADAVGDADLERFQVSVLSPLGLSILGRRTGDIVDGRVRIDELLYQPEAAGDFHL